MVMTTWLYIHLVDSKIVACLRWDYRSEYWIKETVAYDLYNLSAWLLFSNKVQFLSYIMARTNNFWCDNDVGFQVDQIIQLDFIV